MHAPNNLLPLHTWALHGVAVCRQDPASRYDPSQNMGTMATRTLVRHSHHGMLQLRCPLLHRIFQTYPCHVRCSSSWDFGAHYATTLLIALPESQVLPSSGQRDLTDVVPKARLQRENHLPRKLLRSRWMLKGGSVGQHLPSPYHIREYAHAVRFASPPAFPKIASSGPQYHCLSLRLSMLQGTGPRGQIDAQYQTFFLQNLVEHVLGPQWLRCTIRTPELPTVPVGPLSLHLPVFCFVSTHS